MTQADAATPLTPWQQAIAKTYAQGGFAHVQTLEDCCGVGDTLFTAIMIETSPREDCDTADDALIRLSSMFSDVDRAMAAVETIS